MNARFVSGGIFLPRSVLDDWYQNGTEQMDAKFQDKIKEMIAEIEKMAPNMRAVDK